ncbi:MAG: CBS domain-containing protein [Candidatus Diapherotrites archaeon]|nr:CBS domain-containing protein [Candidatus Diapherotrites archaeon]
MLPELAEIKARRKAAGLTQSELASMSGVSQSLIAKLESEKIEPSYGKVKRLLDCLQQLRQKSDLQAKDIMTKSVFTVEASESAKKAVKILEKHSLSQLPVLRKGLPVGAVSERSILAGISSGMEKKSFEKALVGDVMEESMPTIQENAPASVVSQLLNFASAVLVMKKGKIAGIITKSDLLKQMIK